MVSVSSPLCPQQEEWEAVLEEKRKQHTKSSALAAKVQLLCVLHFCSCMVPAPRHCLASSWLRHPIMCYG